MNLKLLLICASVGAILTATPVYAINAKYAKQLERSGCTQISEMQGCDINKTKEENAKAGFANPVPNTSAKGKRDAGKTPYAGHWVAKTASGTTVASIRIDGKNRVWVNDKKVKAKLSDGALVFKQGIITYTIQGDRRLANENNWHDSDANTKGPIQYED